MVLFYQGFGWGRNKFLERTSEPNLDPQSSDILAVENMGVREVIPVPDSLGKETTFIGLYTSRWKLKCLGVTISTTPSLWGKVICRYSLDSNMIIRPPFRERLHLRKTN